METKQKKRPAALWALLLAMAALAVGYIVLCSWVQSETILPNTVVSGVDISGMSRADAESALQEGIQQEKSSLTLTVSAQDTDYAVEVGDALGINCAALAEKAIQPGSGPFLTRGFFMLKAWTVGSRWTAYPQVVDKELFAQQIEGSGLLDADTAVQTSWEISGDSLLIHMGTAGVKTDEQALTDELEQAVADGRTDKALECPTEESPVEPVDWTQVEKDTCREAANATLKLDDSRRSYQVVDAVQGVSFDRKEAESLVSAAGEGETVTVPLIHTEADITAEQLREKLFADQLGSYTTKVGGTAARISNVTLAAQSCDGIILCSGDQFSYNDTLGERTAENGYQAAGAYLNGETVQELGGGICQVSSTLYASVLYSNLEIVERHNHTFASSYIGLGMDATVSWGGPDFQFANNTDYPIQIKASYSGGYVTVSILGTKVDDSYVDIKSETLETTPFTTETKKTTSLKKGRKQVTQKGQDGYKVQTYRIVYEGDGSVRSNEKEAYSVYKPEKKIVMVGSKKKKSKKKRKSKRSKRSGKSKKSSKGKKRKS